MDDSERAELESLLGHRFGDVQWLERALTHRSHAVASGAPNNERLEFLGDSVLGLAVSCRLVSKFPQWDEGRLSKARARLVGVASAEQAANRFISADFCAWARARKKRAAAKSEIFLPTPTKRLLALFFAMPDSTLPQILWTALCSAIRPCSPNCLPSPTTNPRCRNGCKAAARVLRNIASLRKAAPSTQKHSAWPFVSMAALLPKPRAAAKNPPSRQPLWSH